MPDFDLRDRLRPSPKQQRFARRCALTLTPPLSTLGRKAARADRRWPACGQCRARASSLLRSGQGCRDATAVQSPPPWPLGWTAGPGWPESWRGPGWSAPRWQTASLGKLARSNTAAPPSADGSTSGSSSGAQFAVNTPKFGHADEGETGLGTDEDIARDLAALGVGVARHPGRIQLFYGEILGGPIPFSFYEAAKQISRHGVLRDKLDRLERIVVFLADNDIDLKLVVTLVTLGGEITSPGYDYPPGRDKPIALSWYEGHAGQTGVDEVGRPIHFDTAGGAYPGWDLNTLDPANMYKRTYLRGITTIVGDEIAALATRLRTRHRIRLSNYIAGFELFNEIETKHLGPDSATGDPTNDGTSWGTLYAGMAAALLDPLPWARVFLPGLQSFDDTGDDWAQWQAKPAFVQAMLEAAEYELTALGSGYSLADIVAGIDLHFYHGERTGALSLAYLATDVAEIRGVLTGGDFGINDPIVSVIESGINVICGPADDSGTTGTTPSGAGYDSGCEAASGDWAYPSKLAYDDLPLPDGTSKAPIHLRPNLGRCIATGRGLDASSTYSTELGANDFQGANLWMRLAVALAGGADIVGWHTLMGTLGTNFMGQGLRRDLHAIDAGWRPEADAEERPSWYALRRMAELLTGASGISVLSPRAFANHQDVQDSEPLPDRDKVWVIQVADVPSLGSSQRAYLVFIDPFGTVPLAPGKSGDEDDAPLCARVTFSLGRRTTFLSQVSTAPLAAARVPRRTGLPRTLWTDPPVETLPVTTSGTTSRAQVTVRRWDWPQLIFSSTALTVDAVELA